MNKISVDYKLIELSNLQFLDRLECCEDDKRTASTVFYTNKKLNKIIDNQNEIIKALLKVIEHQKEDDR